MGKAENRIERIAKRITAMARFGYYGGFRFFIYSYDINEKEHIHAEKDGKIAKFWLNPVKEAKRGRMSSKLFERCRELVIEHEEEFIQKFNEEKEKAKNANSNKKAYSISKFVVAVLPVVENLLKSIDLRKIKNIIPEEDERACLITFKRIQGVEPWLEICEVPNKGQHVHLEIEIPGEPDFEFDSFVTTSNKAGVVKEITKEIDKAYERKHK